jgi:hypothetical protein
MRALHRGRSVLDVVHEAVPVGWLEREDWAVGVLLSRTSTCPALGLAATWTHSPPLPPL